MELRLCKKCMQMTNHRIDTDGTENCLKCGWKRQNRKVGKKRFYGKTADMLNVFELDEAVSFELNNLPMDERISQKDRLRTHEEKKDFLKSLGYESGEYKFE